MVPSVAEVHRKAFSAAGISVPLRCNGLQSVLEVLAIKCHHPWVGELSTVASPHGAKLCWPSVTKIRVIVEVDLVPVNKDGM